MSGGLSTCGTSLLTKSQLIKLLVDVAAVNDVVILNEDRNLPAEVCAPEDRATVRRMAAVMMDLLRTFDYERSTEFGDAIAGKSSAVVAMKRRLASAPVRRAEQRRRFEAALGDMLSGTTVYSLAPREGHEGIRNLIDLAGRLRNPD